MQNKHAIAWKPFPVSLLPSPVQEFVAAGAKAINVDSAFLAVPVLVACAGAIGNARRIRLKSTWTELPTLWAAVVAESGSGKSPAMKMALEPCEQLNQDAYAQYTIEMERFQCDRLKWKEAFKSWQRGETIGEPPLEPYQPHVERLLVNDTTIEALSNILMSSPRGVVVSADELSGWFHSHRRYGNAGDASLWLSLHSAGSLAIDRASGNQPTKFIRPATASIIGGVQPGVLNHLMTPEYLDSGLMARFLLVRPPRMQKKWSSHDVPSAVLDQYTSLIRALRSLAMDEGTSGRGEAITVDMTDEARDRFIEFYDNHGAQQPMLAPALDAAWSKLEAYAARLALVLHCINEVHQGAQPSGRIEVDVMEAAISLTHWFADEVKRFYTEMDGGALKPELIQLLEYIESQGGCVTSRNLKRGPSRFRSDAALAQQELDFLVKNGFGDWEHTAPSSAGGRPSQRFRLHDRQADPVVSLPDTGQVAHEGELTEYELAVNEAA